MAYDPDQPRDEQGQWVETSGGEARADRVVNGLTVTQGESNAITHYQHASPEINNRLRQDRLNKDTARMTEQFDAMFARVEPLNEPLTVYRAFDVDHATIRRDGFMRDKGYASTSTSRTMSKEFLGDTGRPGLIEITLPRGARVLRLSGRSSNEYAHEREVILPRNAPIKVTSVQRPRHHDEFSDEVVKYKGTYVPERRYKG